MDKGEIIRRLKKISSHAIHVVGEPPFIMSLDDGIALDEAVQLLKEQEAVEPIPPTDESDLWKCGNCSHQLFRCTHQRYCDMCGKAVKWE